MTLHVGLNDYPGMVTEYTPDPFVVAAGLHPYRLNAMLAAANLSVASGELLKHTREIVISNQPADVTKMIGLLGAIEFSLEQMRQSLDVSRDTILYDNMSATQRKHSTPAPKAFPEEAPE